jgi:hypothetical protein
MPRPEDSRLGGAAKKLGNDLAGLLPPLARDLLQPLGVVALDAHQDRELRAGVSLVDLDLVRPCPIELGVEVARLRIGIGPGIIGHLNQGFYAHVGPTPNR